MLQAGEKLNLAGEPFDSDLGGDIAIEDLDGNQSTVLPVLGEVNCGHPAASDLAADLIAISKDFFENAVHSCQPSGWVVATPYYAEPSRRVNREPIAERWSFLEGLRLRHSRCEDNATANGNMRGPSDIVLNRISESGTSELRA